MTNKKTLNCYVLMPFGTSNEYHGGPDESNYVYEAIIKKGVEQSANKLGLTVNLTREVDRLVPGSITRSVFKALANSDIVIVDITGRNPNVFYALGIRHTLSRKNTIILCQEDEIIPFDISGYRIVRYKLFDAKDAMSAIADTFLILTQVNFAIVRYMMH